MTFQKAFLLNRNIGELPAGRYQVEIDEEEIGTSDCLRYRRPAIYLLVQEGSSTRTIAATPKEFDTAVVSDLGTQAF